MVIGEQFAWAHLPKTGGDATLAMFRVFADLVEFADPEDTDAKHALFRDRWDQVQGKTLVMNFRRLPSWVLSRAQHVASRGIWPDYQPIPMQSPHELSDSAFPDTRVGLYTDEGRIEIDRWLRSEHLAEDFLAFVSGLREVTAAERRAVIELGGVNELRYDHEISHWFTPEQVQRMYERNSRWAAIEERLYEGLIQVG